MPKEVQQTTIDNIFETCVSFGGIWNLDDLGDGISSKKFETIAKTGSPKRDVGIVGRPGGMCGAAGEILAPLNLKPRIPSLENLGLGTNLAGNAHIGSSTPCYPTESGGGSLTRIPPGQGFGKMLHGFANRFQ